MRRRATVPCLGSLHCCGSSRAVLIRIRCLRVFDTDVSHNHHGSMNLLCLPFQKTGPTLRSEKILPWIGLSARA
jgi:hypothetical protein